MIKCWTSIPCLMGYRLSRLLTHFFGPSLAVDNRKVQIPGGLDRES